MRAVAAQPSEEQREGAQWLAIAANTVRDAVRNRVLYIAGVLLAR